MNIFDIIPGITGIIEKFVPDPQKAAEAKLELAKLELQESIEGKKLVSSMVSHDSIFVAGSIPSIIWIAVVSLTANCIIFPLLGGFGINIAPFSLPEEYWGLLKVTILCLFGKKAWDGNEIRWGDKLITPSKAQTDAAAARGITTPVGDKEDYQKKYEAELKKRGIKK